MRLWIFCLLVFCSFLPAHLAGQLLLRGSLSDQIESRTQELQYQLNTLSKQLAKAGYMDDQNVFSVNSELSLLSEIYDGRIMIVDRTFEIIKDTYAIDEGKYNVSEGVLRCFQGEAGSVYSKRAQRIQIILPIYDAGLAQVNGAVIMTSSTRVIENMVDSYYEMAGVIDLVVLICAAFLAFFLSSLLVRPLKKVTEAINKAAFGDMDLVEVKDCVETERICGAYNQTLTRLKTLDESRQEFVSNVSHELKTPLASIRVLADSLMSMEEAPVELYREFMGDISDEIDRESTIIEDLLTLVRLDKSSTELKVGQISINEMLELVLKRLSPLAQKRNIELVLESFRPVVAEIDEVKLTLAVTNLVENAIKYNIDDGWVRVSLNADHNFFYIKVQDSGLGIPEEAQGKVFERFYRVDKARSRETGGTGLGLAITYSVIQLHHGAIKLYSKEGEGSTFTVRIPLIYIA